MGLNSGSGILNLIPFFFYYLCRPINIKPPYMYPLVRAILFFSYVAFIFMLLFSYYQLPPLIGFLKSGDTMSMQQFDKQDIYYIFGGFFVLFNLLIILFYRAILKIDPEKLSIPNKNFWTQDEDSREALHKVFQVWTDSFAAIVNIFLALILLFIYFMNTIQLGSLAIYAPIVYAFMTIIALWFLVLIFRLLYKKFYL